MIRNSMMISTIAILLIGVAFNSFADPNEPDFMKQLFPPELVMRHASEMDLRKSQRKAITKAVIDTQAATIEIGWDMQDAAVRLERLINQTSIDEEAAMAAAVRVMELEVKVKRAHMRLLIQIKNQLDPAQQEKLLHLRARDKSS